MFKKIREKFAERKRKKLIAELKFIEIMVAYIQKENEQLEAIEKKCAQESLGHLDKTRDRRLEARKKVIYENRMILEDCLGREAYLKQKLEIV